MSDAADIAKDLEMAHRDRALQNQLASRVMEQPRIVGKKRLCLDCDFPIEKKRIEANPAAVRCTECQSYHEK